MSKSPGIPYCFVKFFCNIPFGFHYALNYHLRDAVAGLQDLFTVRKVDQQNLNFSPVVSINCAGAVETGDALFEREAASGPNLCFVALRKFNMETGWHQDAFEGSKLKWAVDLRANIHAGREGACAPAS